MLVLTCNSSQCGMYLSPEFRELTCAKSRSLFQEREEKQQKTCLDGLLDERFGVHRREVHDRVVGVGRKVPALE